MLSATAGVFMIGVVMPCIEVLPRRIHCLRKLLILSAFICHDKKPFLYLLEAATRHIFPRVWYTVKIFVSLCSHPLLRNGNQKKESSKRIKLKGARATSCSSGLLKWLYQEQEQLGSQAFRRFLHILIGTLEPTPVYSTARYQCKWLVNQLFRVDASLVLLCKNRLVLRVGFSILGAMAETKATSPAEAKASSSYANETKDANAGEKEEVKAAPKAAPARPKPAAKAPAKPLPELMAEDVIPSLKTILEAHDDLSEIELSFQDNKLEGSFPKKGCSYSFWAFFPNGILTGSKGFALSSYGSGASTVEPFLIDEKKITAKHVVFWVEKRLAAQGIIPVRKNDI
ncbi:uncharacterized protein LOC111313115 [Durio zibethinus]|uniref:Uncharacterized protein LOC111313115 n=1 Tax=Durio zibethinus TaxID=66656 RepID=A0A6P6AXF6_DURZI|nr:uncharacterized protein LOC111313115 [Durio zibethinus]